MVLTKPELVGALQHEIHILLHLASKIDRDKLDYRPTPKQRSTLELLKYLSVMGPALVEGAKTGKFDTESWTARDKAAQARDFDQTLAEIGTHRDLLALELGAISDEGFREQIEMFGQKFTRGSFLVTMLLSGYAAYRTQLFCYLKANGREELNTMNLWAGVDAPMATT